MTIKQFSSLSLLEKNRVIRSHSTLVHTKAQSGYKINLYSLHHYFVEVKKNILTKGIVSIEVKQGIDIA